MTSKEELGVSSEIARGDRFEFGKNWSRFVSQLNEDKILAAEGSLKDMLGVETLAGKRLLDIGSGSGLFSLAARRLGAQVRSFDYDLESVRCTAELRARYFPSDQDWIVEQGSALDLDYMKALGNFDVVYSWGVLHHTGAMWQALDNAIIPTQIGSTLCVAIYNDQMWLSKYWRMVKRTYNSNPILRLLIILGHLGYPLGASLIVRTITGRLKLPRGMSYWYDYLDWLGGYPFEVAKPENIFSFFRDRGFTLMQLKTCGGRQGCNEFVFKRGATGQT